MPRTQVTLFISAKVSSGHALVCETLQSVPPPVG